MILARIRLGFLLATLLTSLHVAAVPRYWTLTGVQLEDGAVATGYVSYDDATGTIVNWNLRVSGGAEPFIAWTIVPGISHAWDSPHPYLYSSPQLYLYSYEPDLVPGFWWRSLVITPLVPLDGRSTTVPINVSRSLEFFENDYDGGNPSFRIGPSRKFVAGSLLLSASPPPVTIIDAGFTGAWYNPEQSGHGLFIEVLPENRMLVAWLTFSPGGEQSWFLGVGPYLGNMATTISANQPTGGRWIPNFDPARIVHNVWGSLTVTFTDCNHGRVDFDSPHYGFGSMNITRLTQPAGTNCSTTSLR